MFFIKWFSSSKEVLDPFEKSIKEFEDIKQKPLNNVFSSDMTIISLHSMCSNINEYIKLLDNVLNSIKSDQLVSQYSIPDSTLEVSIFNFFIDSNNYYIDPSSKLIEFCDLSIEFIKLYKQHEELYQKEFIIEKNLFITQRLCSNLFIISNNLLMSV